MARSKDMDLLRTRYQLRAAHFELNEPTHHKFWLSQEESPEYSPIPFADGMCQLALTANQSGAMGF